jgi:hypothetical protein
LDAGILLLARGTTTTAPVARFLAEVSENVHLIEAIGLPRIPTAPAAPPPAGSAPGFDLRAAVAACPPGGTVNMPAGTITVAGDVTLKSNIKLKGQGVGVTVLKASGDFPLIITGTGVTLEGFTLQGNGQKAAGAQYGISVNYGDSASNITMRNLQVSDFSEAGFFGAGMSVINDLVIEDCVFSRCGDFGITKVGASVSSRWTIRNTVCYDFAGVRNPPHGIYLHNVKDLLIDGCELYGPLGHHPSGYSGVELDDCQGTVRNSYAHDCMTTADDGYGFIVVGSCQIVFDTCRGERNAADFFECRLTGTATYQNCTGSKKVY